MAQKPKEPAAERPSGATLTLHLSRPLSNGAASLTQLLINEPELRHVVLAGRAKGMQEQTIALIAAMAGLPIDVIGRLKMRDAKAITSWFDGLRAAALADDGFVDDADGRTFTLTVPITDNGRVITEIRVREPDLAAGVATEPFKTEGEQMQAMIASLTGLTIPVVAGLRLRDVTRIEAYVTPLLDGTTPNAANGSNSALPIAGA